MTIDPIIISLENLHLESDIDEIRQSFEENTVRVSSIINSDPLDREIRIYKSSTTQDHDRSNENFYTLGINRKLDRGVILLEIRSEFPEFMPIFLLREVYLRFVPLKLKEYKIINIFINQFVQEDLSHLKIIEKWKSIVEKQVVDKKLLDAHMDRIEKFFKKKDITSDSNPRAFFFEYLRRNVMEIREDDREFYEKLYASYVYEGRTSLRDEDVLKTIKDLFNIFHEVKSYRALQDYKRYFQDFKNKNIIRTDLSLAKFIDNLKWLSNFTDIAPNYFIKWEIFKFRSSILLLVFNPVIPTSKIIKIMEMIPFFGYSRYSMTNFSRDIFGYCIIPEVFINDLRNFLDQMKKNYYLLDFILIFRNYMDTSLNLNYFRQEFDKGQLTEPEDDSFKKDFLLISPIPSSELGRKDKLSFLDFLILDRARYFSSTGLPLERRSETLRLLKEDFYKKKYSDERNFSMFKKSIGMIKADPLLLKEIIGLIEKSFQANYFSVRDYLNDLLKYRELTDNILKNHKNIKNIIELKEFMGKNFLINSFSSRRFLKNEELKNHVINEYSHANFASSSHLKGSSRKKERYKLYLDFLDSCIALNLIEDNIIKNLIINNDEYDKFINYKTKELKIKFKKTPVINLSSDSFEDKIEEFTTNEPIMLYPCMINTILTTGSVSKTFYILILKNDDVICSTISGMRSYFPRTNLLIGEDDLICFEFYSPTLTKQEKLLLYLSISTLFKDNIIYFKRLFTTGLLKPLDLSTHYDFMKNELCYSKTLFPQFFKHVKRLLSKNKSFEKKPQNLNNIFSIPQATLYELAESTSQRIANQEINFDFKNISDLYDFNRDLNKYISGIKKIDLIKEKPFFTTYIDKISFIPNFSAFGFSQYYLYVKPLDLGEIDFKLLLSNTFQKVEFTASIDRAPSFLIKYLFPFHNANRGYINRLIKVDKNASEYCFFSLEKVYHVLHFEKNLSSSGWDADTKIAQMFKLHAHSVIFGSQRERENYNIRIFSLSEAVGTEIFGKKSREFEQLFSIYSHGAKNLKKFVNIQFSKKIHSLTHKELLFPYIRLKNLNLNERISIVIPKVESKYNDILLRIFSFFNYCFIFHIKGEYYIRDDPENKVREIKNGFMIKLRLPPLELSHLRESISEIFETLGIEHYLILTDLIDFNLMLEQIFPGEDFEHYNPLNNLIWDERNKEWKNTKLYGEALEKKYPSLI